MMQGPVAVTVMEVGVISSSLLGKKEIPTVGIMLARNSLSTE